MSKLIENYLLQEVIGSGQYGKVYRGKNVKTDEEVAIKVVKGDKFKEVPKLYEFTMNEIKTLSKIENPNVIKFIEMLRTQNNMYLIYEFCNGGTLEEFIQKKKFLTEKESYEIFEQILNAFKSLVKENILHRDLKPSNILLNDGVIKVADFGFCKALLGPQEMTKTMVGSPIYMAPEILKGCNYSIKADIWSMGVVLFEMLFGYCPYEDRTIARLINKIDTKALSIPKNKNSIHLKTEELLRKMLVVDPRYRITWQNLLQFNKEEIINPEKILKENPNILNDISNTNVNNIVDEKYKRSFKKNLKMMYKERNKLFFLTKVIESIIENCKEGNTILVLCYLLKKIKSLINFIKPLIACDFLEKMPFAKKLESPQKFKESNEYKNFSDIVSKEIKQLTSFVQMFLNELQKSIESIPEECALRQKIEIAFSSENKDLKSYLKEDLLEFIQKIKEKSSFLEKRKMLMLGNDLMDCINIEDVFDNHIDRNMKFSEQNYFENMKKFSDEDLVLLLEKKIALLQN